MDVVQQRTRRVCGVGGMHFAAGETPQEIRVDSAKSEFAARCRIARICGVIQEPREFSSGKIRIEQQSGLGYDERFVTVCLQLRACIGGSPVLPYDCAMHSMPAGALPQQRGFALIGYSDWAMSLAVAPAPRIALRQVSRVVRHRSSGSCSTWPSAGKCCGNSCWATDAIDVSARNRMA